MLEKMHGVDVESGDQASTTKKRKSGFSVGPANLPDGLHKRKVQKIKKDLIRTAKIRKDYAKLLKQRHDDRQPPVSLGIHPERQAMLDAPEAVTDTPAKGQPRKHHKHKPAPLQKEHIRAQKQKEERERKRKEIEEAQRLRTIKRDEHERFRKSMEKARKPNKNGQRRLGRESKLLPKMVENLFERIERQKTQREDIT